MHSGLLRGNASRLSFCKHLRHIKGRDCSLVALIKYGSTAGIVHVHYVGARKPCSYSRHRGATCSHSQSTALISANFNMHSAKATARKTNELDTVSPSSSWVAAAACMQFGPRAHLSVRTLFSWVQQNGSLAKNCKSFSSSTYVQVSSCSEKKFRLYRTRSFSRSHRNANFMPFLNELRIT